MSFHGSIRRVTLLSMIWRNSDTMDDDSGKLSGCGKINL